MVKPLADDRPALRPPQFGLRTLLLIVAACGVLFGLHSWGVPPVVTGALGFLAASIFCHVAGNCLGTRLRTIGDLSQPGIDEGRTRRPLPQDFAPRTRLGERRSLGWAIVIASSIGMTSGAIGGGLWTFVAGHGQVGLFNVAVGVIAFAVLGGIAAFATVGFTQVLFGAVWQAMQPSPPSDSLGKRD